MQHISTGFISVIMHSISSENVPGVIFF